MTARMSVPGDPTAPPEFWKIGGYLAATVCRRGHVQSSNVGQHPKGDLGRCPECGANVLVACPRCGLRIRGTSNSVVSRPGSSGAPNFRPPNCCDGCGAPHPWASRQARIYELENLLDEEDIDDADRLMVTEHLRQLQELDPGEDLKRERKLWEAVQRRAPGLFAGAGRRILDTLIDLATRRALGMDG